MIGRAQRQAAVSRSKSPPTESNGSAHSDAHTIDLDNETNQQLVAEIEEEESATVQAEASGPSREEFVNDLMSRFMAHSGDRVASEGFVKRVISDLAERTHGRQTSPPNAGDVGDAPSPDVDDDEHEECPICLDLFSNPVITPCAHVTCFDCLPNAKAAGKNMDAMLSCPVCRLPFKRGHLTFVAKQPDVDEEAETARKDAFGSLTVPPLATKWSKYGSSRDAKSISDAIGSALRRQRLEREAERERIAKIAAKSVGAPSNGANTNVNKSGPLLQVPTIEEMKSGKFPFKISSKLEVCTSCSVVFWCSILTHYPLVRLC